MRGCWRWPQPASRRPRSRMSAGAQPSKTSSIVLPKAKRPYNLRCEGTKKSMYFWRD
jgi:hypothetical protein